MRVEGVERLVAKLEYAAGREGRRAALEVIGETLADLTLERFATETDPSGRKWAQSERARRKGGQTLTDTAHGRRSFNHKVLSDEQVAVGTNVVYLLYHQIGAEIPARERVLHFKTYKGGRHKGKTLFSKSRNATFAQKVNVKAYRLPVRKTLPEKTLSPAYEREIVQAVEVLVKARFA